MPARILMLVAYHCMTTILHNSMLTGSSQAQPALACPPKGHVTCDRHILVLTERPWPSATCACMPIYLRFVITCCLPPCLVMLTDGQAPCVLASLVLAKRHARLHARLSVSSPAAQAPLPLAAAATAVAQKGQDSAQIWVNSHAIHVSTLCHHWSFAALGGSSLCWSSVKGQESTQVRWWRRSNDQTHPFSYRVQPELLVSSEEFLARM
eukprot:scaffold65387_cov20-Tisochrysis_lutea.AAC.1